jgi:hypothetical protein
MLAVVGSSMPICSSCRRPGLLVEQAQHHALAAAGRNGRHAHVDRPVGDAQGNAAVLRHAFLGDVELGHDLDARHQQRGDGGRRLHDLAQHAVHAQAYRQARFEGSMWMSEAFSRMASLITR